MSYFGFRQAAYTGAVFVSSACGLIVEIVAGRLIAPYVGMSLYTWTAIIAVVLAGLSAGHWIGGRLAHPHVGDASGGRRVAFALALASVSTLASLVLLRRVSAVLLGGDLDLIAAIVLLTAALFFLPSLFVGIVSPILTKLAVDADPGRYGPVIGRMYAFGTLGSIAGTLAAGYLFISWIGSTGTVIAVAVMYAVMALAFAAVDAMRLLVLALLVVGSGGFAWWGGKVAAFASPCEVESDYFCIRIADYDAETGRPSRLMALDHLVHSINDRDDPGMLYSPYIQGVDELAKLRMETMPTGHDPSAFFIGGGGYTLPRAWLHDYANPELIVAEIDPAVSAAARDRLWLDADDTALRVRHQDARMVLQSLPRKGQFDLVFGDAFHDISIPAHLVTREFHREIAARLAEAGFYAANVVDSGARPRFLLSYVKTLKADFPFVEVWLERQEAANPGRVTFIVLASRRATPVGSISALRGPERTWIRWPGKAVENALTRSDLPILTDDFAPVDRLMSHLLLKVD